MIRITGLEAWQTRAVVRLMMIWLLLGAVSEARAQEKTPQNAFEFVQRSLSDGSWSGDVQNCFRDGSCSTEQAKIEGVTFEASSYCQLDIRLSGRDGTLHRRLDLTKEHTFSDIGAGLWVQGAVAMTNGEVLPDWMLYSSSSDMRSRVALALRFLQDACLPKSIW